MTLLIDGKVEKGIIVLAHGAGAGADHPFMETFAKGVAAAGFQVIRFNFPYMEKRKEDGRKRPPDRAPKLLEAYENVVRSIPETNKPLIIGGKSMGGRIASMLAAGNKSLKIDGLVCLGYPFHAPGKPDRIRTEHFPDISVPTLIVQGERDPFGGTDLLAGLAVPKNFTVHWAPDGNHDLTPRKASGHSQQGNWEAAMKAIAAFADKLQD
ncbi:MULTISPECIES: alpha/beta fold hydrolase [Kordiimonas]|jgi:hypothetical protein|uniref:alpha/beta fold hydrolase n=1 Tax=Kordiimonas TaxID=288021 RepID=UPI00257D38A2|nr:alpha/beta fold hydrolase [Kordiimonas sp. UBA4487]